MLAFLGKHKRSYWSEWFQLTGKLLGKAGVLGYACIWVCSHQENFWHGKRSLFIICCCFDTCLNLYSSCQSAFDGAHALGMRAGAEGPSLNGNGGLFHQGDTAWTWEDVHLTPRSPPCCTGFFLDDRKAKINISLPLGNTNTPRLYFPGTLMEFHFHAYGGVFHAPVKEESPAR